MENDKSISELAQEKKEEIAKLREREQERHAEKMEQINEEEEQVMDSVHKEAGLDRVESLNDEIVEKKNEVLGVRKDIRSLVNEAISSRLSGGYEKTVTVKNGSVHKYKKRRGSHISPQNYCCNDYRGHRDLLVRALEQEGYDSRVVGAIKHVMEMVDEESHLLSGGFIAKSEVSIQNPNKEEQVFDKMVLRCRATSRIDESDSYVKLEDEDGYGYKSRQVIDLSTRNPEEMAILHEGEDEVLTSLWEMQEDIEEQYEHLLGLKDEIEHTLSGLDG